MDVLQRQQMSELLFSLLIQVSHKFPSIFMEQQRMQTFPDYEAQRVTAENLGLVAPALALKKESQLDSLCKGKGPVVKVSLEGRSAVSLCPPTSSGSLTHLAAPGLSVPIVPLPHHPGGPGVD